jgi:hypothetical protein
MVAAIGVSRWSVFAYRDRDTAKGDLLSAYDTPRADDQSLNAAYCGTHLTSRGGKDTDKTFSSRADLSLTQIARPSSKALPASSRLLHALIRDQLLPTGFIHACISVPL